MNTKTLKRFVILSDVHVPVSDKQAVDVALDYIKESRPDAVYINGDFIDCEALSIYDKYYTELDVAYELSCAHDLLAKIKKAARDAPVLFRLGNHEERYERYIMRHAQKLANIRDVRIEYLLRLDKLHVKFAGYARRPLWLTPQLALFHGHELLVRAQVNIARSVLYKTMYNVIVGHWHRTQVEYHRNLKGNMIGAWTSGCLCDLQPKWLPVNNWNHGFVEVVVRKSAFEVFNYRVVGGDICM